MSCIRRSHRHSSGEGAAAELSALSQRLAGGTGTVTSFVGERAGGSGGQAHTNGITKEDFAFPHSSSAEICAAHGARVPVGHQEF